MKRSADPNSDKMQAEFRRKLENYKAAPSENLWDKIELSLDKEEALVYKNRYRMYSWLAAACLVLLLSFAIIFVPRKWEQLQNQQAEIAAAKTSQTNKANSETKAPVLANKNAPETNLPQESIALNTPQLSSEETLNQTEDLISGQETTVGEKAQKVPVRSEKTISGKQVSSALSPELIAANPAPAKQVLKSSGTVSKTAVKPVSNSGNTFEEVTLAAVSPQQINAETSGKTGSSEETPEIAKGTNAEVAGSSGLANTNVHTESGISSQSVSRTASIAANTANHNVSQKIISPEVVANLTGNRAGSFSDQDPTVSEVGKTENNEPFPGKNEQEIPQAVLAKVEQPVTSEKNAVIAEEKPEKEKKDRAKAGKWVVSGSYAALSFNSGIRLAGRSFEPETSPGIVSVYKQNISAYETAIQEYNHETSAAYSQKGGVLVGFKMAKKWLLQTGFNYFQNREQTNSSYIFARNPNNTYPGQPALTSDAESQTTLGTVLSNNFDPSNCVVMPASEYTTQYSYQYYSLPLNLRFQTGEPGIYYFAGAGGAVNFLDQTTIETETTTTLNTSIQKTSTQAEKDAQPDVYRKSLLSVQLETGLGYSFSSHWSAELALTGNRFLKPLIKDEQMAGAKQQNARSFGATLNLGYTF